MQRGNILIESKEAASGLSLLFATLCIIDIFGVFPIIALPRAIVLCGWLGIPLVLIVFGLQIYTASLLGKSWNIATIVDPQINRKNRYPLAAVTELTLGKWASTCVTVLLDLTVFGGGIPNLLVASQNLQLFGLKVSQQTFNMSFCYWLLVVGILLCPIMWLGSPRDMKWLVTFSAVTVSSVALLIWWSIVTDERNIDYSPVSTSPPWSRFLQGYGILAFQFDVHPTLMTIQVDMKKSKDINRAVILAFLFSGSLFAITAILAVWRYGSNTTANVLEVVPPGAPIEIAVLLAALQLCLSSAIGHSALFQHLEDTLGIHRTFGWKRCAMRSAAVVLAVAVGESVPRFDIVMSLIGGTLTGPLIFVLPPLMYTKARALRNASLRRSSAPEFLCSGPARSETKTGEIFSDPRVHSRSTHYGFRDGNSDKEDGYSFTYYDRDDDTESLLDEDDRITESLLYRDDSTLKRRSEVLELTRSESLPVMLDASQPSVRRPRHYGATSDVSVVKPRKFWTMQRLISWFGYLIVLIGILITVSSTFINVRNTIRFVQFTPPCIFNASAIIPSLG